MNRIKLTNDFHGTSTTILSRETNGYDAYRSLDLAATAGVTDDAKRAARTLSRVRKSLCGMSDCRCGIVRGRENGIDQVEEVSRA